MGFDWRAIWEKIKPAPPPEPVQCRHELVWSGPTDTYKLVGLLGTPYGLVASTSNVYRGGHRSRIWRDGACVYEGGEETIGQPFLAADLAVFPVEHGSHSLMLADRTPMPGPRARGRWSVAGGRYRGQALLAYNNEYSARRFLDHPQIIDALSGQPLYSLQVQAMPRCLVELGGQLYVSYNFGEAGVLRYPEGRQWPCNIVQIAAYRDQLYGAESAAWGPSGHPSTAGGRVYRLAKDKWKQIGDTGSSCVTHMAAFGGRLWIAGVDPDRLWVMDRAEKFYLAAEEEGESADDRARSFGGAVAEHQGAIYWGRSDKRRAHIYRVITA